MEPMGGDFGDYWDAQGTAWGGKTSAQKTGTPVVVGWPSGSGGTQMVREPPLTAMVVLSYGRTPEMANWTESSAQEGKDKWGDQWRVTGWTVI